MTIAKKTPIKVSHQGANGGKATPMITAVKKALLSYKYNKTGRFLR